ncbi:hypothetical protein PFLU3_39040 [Pseudomonas fluorescens]|uniref:Uncharacterized protein n=1 Tax=Pseudomonas fluorescens TaxID=294 RepID=A0A0D0TAQ2_PSEFL|nr:hypothetical protein PFLU3_39040 [Pseudomonas fluorescens]
MNMSSDSAAYTPKSQAAALDAPVTPPGEEKPPRLTIMPANAAPIAVAIS